MLIVLICSNPCYCCGNDGPRQLEEERKRKEAEEEARRKAEEERKKKEEENKIKEQLKKLGYDGEDLDGKNVEELEQILKEWKICGVCKKGEIQEGGVMCNSCDKKEKNLIQN